MGLMNEIKNHKYRSFKSLNQGFIFLGFGLMCSLIGPTLLDIQLSIGSSIEEIGRALPIRSFGAILGSTLCGLLLSYIDQQIIISLSFFFLTTTALFIPYCKKLMTFYITGFLNGIFSGLLNIAGNYWIIFLWGKENVPFMQLLHFFFGFGSLISPLIAKPFLKEVSNKNNILIDTENLNFKWAYIICSIISYIILFVFIIVCLIKRKNTQHPSRELNQQEENLIEKRKPSLLLKWYLIILISLFAHCINGVELSFGTMLATFAVKSNLKLSKARASLITSFYWSFFTFFRLFAIFFVKYLSCRSILILNLILVILGNLILLPFGNIYEIALWIGSAFIGAGISSVYPNILGFVENILPVTGKITSIITNFNALGEFVVPLIISAYIDTFPMIFIYVSVIYASISCLVFSFCIIVEYKIYRNTLNNVIS